MKAVIQRVTKAEVRVEGKTVGAIGAGLLVFLGALEGDNLEDVEVLTKKIAHLRVFEDTEGKMNYDVQSIQGSVLVVSQFTLAASYEKGHRPDFLNAAPKDLAIHLYDTFIQKMNTYCKTASGIFGATMEVELVNQGPATFLLNSRNFCR